MKQLEGDDSMNATRMPMLSRSLALFALIAAACVITQPLTAQTSDSTQIKIAKQKADSSALLVGPAIAKQCTFSVQGFFRPACQLYAPLQQMTKRSVDSALILSRAFKPRVDTITRTIYDTLKVTTVRTDTVRQTVTVHDTIYAPLPVPDPTPTPTPTPTPPPVPAPSDTATIVQPDLPRVLLNTAASNTPSTGRTLTVASGGNLQAAFDTAKAGDRIMAACATFPGNFTIRPRSGGVAGGWVTVQTACPLPAEGVRVSSAQPFTKLVALTVLPTLTISGPVTKWRFVGIEFAVDTSLTYHQGLVHVGLGERPDTSGAVIPSDIIFDRVSIHGSPTLDLRHCLTFNGARLAIIDSDVRECHARGFDAQAVVGWNGPGPFKIVNNYLDASSENIAFGGSDPMIQGLVPSDIEIQRNWITKPLSWKGGPWVIKNLLELKQGRRILINGNVFENCWPNGQAGYAFVVWSINAQLTAPWSSTDNITITNNVIKNVAGGWNLAAQGYWTTAQIPMHHVAIRNNVIIGLDNSTIGGNGKIFQISDTIANLSIEHNTAFSPSNSSFMWGDPLPLKNHVVRNNLVGGGLYQLFTVYGQGDIAWKHAGGPGSVFARNAVATFSGANMVAGNWGLGGFSEVGLVGGASAALSVTATLDQLTLAATSQLKGKATDGTDVGADMAKIKAAIAGVVPSAASRATGRVKKP